MDMTQALVLFAAAFVGAAVNAIAGGGGFVAFPALLFTGVAPIQANATSAAALLLGNLAVLGAYRRNIPTQRAVIITLLLVSLAGGTVGGLLLLLTPPLAFVRILPWLLLVATLLFALSGPLAAFLRRRNAPEAPISRRALGLGASAHFASAIYGGYYGGGNGFVILAVLGLMGMRDIHKMNALRTLLAITLNVTAVLTFSLVGLIAWPQVGVMIAGAIIGGYSGGSVARRLSPTLLRGAVILLGAALTVYFFVK
jgi:uncharacterized membrane protein YfcA